MSGPTLVFVTPHAAGSVGLPNRPANLLSALTATGAFDQVIVVNRVRPAVFIGRVGRGGARFGGGLPGITRRLPDGSLLVEHPWPFGGLERRFLQGLLAATARRSAAGLVAWVADPKSVPAVVHADDPGQSRRPWRVVVDAYDAWDRSPLVRGDRRLRAVTDGYHAAAAGADLVFANTAAMRDRLVELGARDARLLPNACPPLDPASADGGVGRSGLVYVGRIHERFDAALAAAVAAALPATTLTIAGPVEREPAGWSTLAAMPNVRFPGRVEPQAARAMIAAAEALVIPHVVDDYTRSQDAMKAWDAIASGTPVISTPIPPADGWPTGLAEVCPDTNAFIAAAHRAVDGRLDAGYPDRVAYAAANQWSDRAAVVVDAIADLTGAPGGAPR